VPLPEFIRTTTFRWGLTVAGIFVLYMLALFTIIYWRTGSYLTSRTDAVVAIRAAVMARAQSDELLNAIAGARVILLAGDGGIALASRVGASDVIAKPIVAAEWGVYDLSTPVVGANKAKVFDTVLPDLTALPAVKAIVYFETARDQSGHDIRVDDTPEALAAFKKVAADPRSDVKL